MSGKFSEAALKRYFCASGHSTPQKDCEVCMAAIDLFHEDTKKVALLLDKVIADCDEPWMNPKSLMDALTSAAATYAVLSLGRELPMFVADCARWHEKAQELGRRKAVESFLGTMALHGMATKGEA